MYFYTCAYDTVFYTKNTQPNIEGFWKIIIKLYIHIVQYAYSRSIAAICYRECVDVIKPHNVLNDMMVFRVLFCMTMVAAKVL